MTLKDLFSKRKKENRKEENGIKTNTANSLVKSDEICHLKIGFKKNNLFTHFQADFAFVLIQRYLQIQVS